MKAKEISSQIKSIKFDFISIEDIREKVQAFETLFGDATLELFVNDERYRVGSIENDHINVWEDNRRFNVKDLPKNCSFKILKW